MFPFSRSGLYFNYTSDPLLGHTDRVTGDPTSAPFSRGFVFNRRRSPALAIVARLKLSCELASVPKASLPAIRPCSLPRTSRASRQRSLNNFDGPQRTSHAEAAGSGCSSAVRGRSHLRQGGNPHRQRCFDRRTQLSFPLLRGCSRLGSTLGWGGLRAARCGGCCRRRRTVHRTRLWTALRMPTRTATHHR